MTDAKLLTHVAEYRAGLDAEIVLLRRLEGLSTRQREASQTGDFDALTVVADERTRMMANLVALEHGLKPVRLMLVDAKERLADVPEFQAVVELHDEAAALVTSILGFDRDSLEALKEAESSRRFAAQAIEKGESTLAAYRRVVAPPLTNATLVNRKG